MNGPVVIESLNKNARENVRIALDTSNDSARHFLGLLGQIKAAKTFDEQAEAITRARQYLESTGTMIAIRVSTTATAAFSFLTVSQRRMWNGCSAC